MHSSGKHPPAATLNDLALGNGAEVVSLEVAPALAEHLMSLGFIPGVEITFARKGPGGGPRIYRVEGAEIALRAELTRRIKIRTATAGPQDQSRQSAVEKVVA